MDKINSKRILVGLFVAAFILLIPLSSSLFACNGGGGGGGSGGGSGGDGAGDAGQQEMWDSIEKPAPTDWSNSSDQNDNGVFSDGQVKGDTIAIYDEPEDTIESTWGEHSKKKPGHWTKQHWKEYIKKRQPIFRHQQKEDEQGMNRANRNLTIAKGTGYVAAGAGAVVGAVATPAVAPVILAVSVVGDGLASTAGSLAEGNSLTESLKDGVKKSVSTGVLSKFSTGKKGADAVIGFVTGQIYDNSAPSTSHSQTEMRNSMPPPSGHDLMGRAHWK